MEKIYDINEVPDNSTIIAFFEFDYGDEFALKEQWFCSKEDYLSEVEKVKLKIQNETTKFIEIPFGTNQEIRVNKLQAYCFVVVDSDDVNTLKKYMDIIPNNKVLNCLYDYCYEGEE